MGKFLDELSRGIGISNDVLEKVIETVGGNYQEVYATLVREYALHKALESLSTACLCFGFILIVILAGLGMTYIDTYKHENEKRKSILEYVKKFFISFLITCLVYTLAEVVNPILTPNVSLILEVIKAGG